MSERAAPPTLEFACPTCSAEAGKPCMITGGWSGTPEAFHLARFRMAEVRAHAEEARAIALNMSHEPMAHAVMEICAALEKLSGGKL